MCVPSLNTFKTNFIANLKREDQKVKTLEHTVKKNFTVRFSSHKVFFLVEIWRLTVSPNFSPLSTATLSDTDIADILLGWVHIILHAAPRMESISDSKMNWGICVVFPQPVSPDKITTCKNGKHFPHYQQYQD